MNLREHIQSYGTDTLTTADLLAGMLSSGRAHEQVTGKVREVLDGYGVVSVKNASVDELHTTAGFTIAQATRLKALGELTKRFGELAQGARVQIHSSEDVASLLQPLMAHLDHEEFRVLLLDTKHSVLANLLLYVGTVDTISLRVAEIFRPALTRNCPAIIVAHNPSGDPLGTPEDRTFTLKLVEAGKLLDVELLDHVIIGYSKYVSLRDQLRWE